MNNKSILAVGLLVGLLLVIFYFSSNAPPKMVTIQSKNPILVNIHFFDTPTEVEKYYQKLRMQSTGGSIQSEPLKDNSKRLGFHYFQNGKTHIVLIKPSSIKYKEFESLLGHEMNHALFGEFHPPSGKLPERITLIENAGGAT